MRHFKLILPRYNVRRVGDDLWQVWDNTLQSWLGMPGTWDEAHLVAEHMERIDATSKRQIEEDDAGLYDGFSERNCERDRSHLVTSTRGHSYYRDGGV